MLVAPFQRKRFNFMIFLLTIFTIFIRLCIRTVFVYTCWYIHIYSNYFLLLIRFLLISRLELLRHNNIFVHIHMLMYCKFHLPPQEGHLQLPLSTRIWFQLLNPTWFHVTNWLRQNSAKWKLEIPMSDGFLVPAP